MGRAKKPRPSALRAFLNLLWQQALFAVPFALFFGTLTGAKREHYIGAYYISLYFAYTIALVLWVVEFVILPRFPEIERADGGKKMMIHIGLFGGGSIVGAFIAALALHFTIMPGFLSNGRSIAMVGMFTLLFAVLFLGIGTAIAFYQKAVEGAKSETELNLARRIQRSFLLSQFPEMPRLEIHALNISSKQVSGDFYDVVPAGENAFLVAIADVAGKGVPAALLSSMLQASLRTQANTIFSASAILKNINALVYRSTSVNQFATFFLARVEEDNMRLLYSNAGHNFPVVFHGNGEMTTLERGGTVVGILETADFEEDSIALRPGDRVVLYTDGISEAANKSGELFGEERLYELVRSLPPRLSAQETTERIVEGVRDFLAGEEAGDDMTLMVLRVLEHQPSAHSVDGRAPAVVSAAHAPAAAASPPAAPAGAVPPSSSAALESPAAPPAPSAAHRDA